MCFRLEISFNSKIRALKKRVDFLCDPLFSLWLEKKDETTGNTEGHSGSCIQWLSFYVVFTMRT